MAVWDDPVELGKRIAAARAYADESQATYGDRIGKSGKTVAAMEKGDPGSLGRSRAARRVTVDLVVEAGAPPEFFLITDEAHRTTRPTAELVDLAEAIRDRLENPESRGLDDLIERLQRNDRPPPGEPGKGQDPERG